MQVEETTQSPLRPTRAGFVRGLPLTMPVEEVIERGREAGIQLQPSDIHAARYYMRQGGEAPQQLTLGVGGKFVTTRDVHRNGNTSNALEKTGVVEKVAADADDDSEDDEAPVAPRRRKIVHSRATQLAQANGANGTNGANGHAAPSTNGTNGTNAKSSVALHDRLQARLPNVTFRETAVTERPAERQTERRAERQTERRAERQTERKSERQTERQIARAKQERQARQERLEKATIGKALLNADSVKSRNKRGSQSVEVLEQQARLIALRIGTQRVRELLDEIEEIARQA